MAVAFVDSASGGANSTTVTCTLPAGISAGDLILLFLAESVDGVSSGLSGYTLLDVAVPSGSNHHQDVYYKVSAGSDSGVTLTVVFGGTGARRIVNAVVYSGCDTTTPIDGYAITTGGSGTAKTTPALSTTVADCVGLVLAGDRGSPASTWTPPAGYTERVDYRADAGSASKSCHISDDLTPISSGTNVGGDTVTSSGSSTNCGVWTLALRPLAAGGGGDTDAAQSSTVAQAAIASTVVVADLTYPAYAAHRGGADVAPDETLAAYELTLPLNRLLAAECDVQVNASGSMVLWHDDTVDGTNAPSTYSDAAWDAVTVAWSPGEVGYPGSEPAAYWAGLADRWGGSRILLPEVKIAAAKTPLIADILARGLVDSCIVQAFPEAWANDVAAAGLHTMRLFGSIVPDFADLAAHGIEHAGIDQTKITSAYVTSAHANGVKVWAYTIASTAQRDAMLALGVDGFFANDPASMYAGTWTAAAASAATATQTAAGSRTRARTAASASTAAQAAAAARTRARTATSASTAAQSVTATRTRARTAAATSIAAQITVAARTRSRNAASASTTSQSAAARATRARTATSASTATQAAAAVKAASTWTRTASNASTAAQSATGARTRSRVATSASTAAQAAAAAATRSRTATTATTATQSAAAFRARLRSAVAASVAAQSAAAAATRSRTAATASTVTQAAVATAHGNGSSSSASASVASQSIAVSVTRARTATSTGTASQVAAGRATRSRAAATAATATQTGQARATRARTAITTATATQSASAQVATSSYDRTATTTATAGQVATATVTRSRSAASAVTATQTTAGQRVRQVAATSTSTAAQAATAENPSAYHDITATATALPRRYTAVYVAGPERTAAAAARRHTATPAAGPVRTALPSARRYTADMQEQT